MLTPESPWKFRESSRQPNLTLEHGKSPVCEWFTCCFSAIGRWGCRRVIDSNSCQSTQLELVSPAFRNVEWHGAVLWTWPEHYTGCLFFNPSADWIRVPVAGLKAWGRGPGGTRSLSIIFLMSKTTPYQLGHAKRPNIQDTYGYVAGLGQTVPRSIAWQNTCREIRVPRQYVSICNKGYWSQAETC